MCEKYPDRVPIICERHQRCTFPSWMHWTLFLSTEGYRGGLRYKQTINRWRTWVECMVRAAFHFLDLHATLGESALSVLPWFVFGRFATTSDTFLLTPNFFFGRGLCRFTLSSNENGLSSGTLYPGSWVHVSMHPLLTLRHLPNRVLVRPVRLEIRK